MVTVNSCGADVMSDSLCYPCDLFLVLLHISIYTVMCSCGGRIVSYVSELCSVKCEYLVSAC